MSSQWTEALASIDTYVKKLAVDKVDTGVTLAVFDKNFGTFDFSIIRDRITPATWKGVTAAEVQPRGYTPLYDAIGRIYAMATSGLYHRVACLCITDGAENASREVTAFRAQEMIADLKRREYQWLQIGADYNNTRQSQTIGLSPNSYIGVPTANLANSMTETARMRASYGATGQSMAFTASRKKHLGDFEENAKSSSSSSTP
jgi:hypothetical protein